MRFSDRVSRIEISATIAVSSEAQRLQASGVDVVDLGAGEPDFPTPEPIRTAAKRALDDNFTKYTSSLGIMALREAIAARYQDDYGAPVKPAQVMVTVGGKQGLFNALMALVNPGDEVIIPAPYWVTFPQIVLFAGGTPVFVMTEAADSFRITAEAIAEKITPRTRVIIVNSPNNPTGAVIEPQELQRIAELAQRHDCVLISDECYSKFLYDGLKPFSAAALDTALQTHVVTAGTMSKTYSMTGWRVGYLITPEPLIHEMLKIQSHSTSNPTSFAQKAAVEALRGPQDCVREMTSEFKRRRDYIVDALNQIPGWKCNKPQGAFYVFPDISAFIETRGLRNGDDFARLLIKDYHVAVTPGSGFGVDGYVRISYAAALDRLQEAIARLRRLQ